MAKGRLSMRKIKEILRLKWACKQSDRQIFNSSCISHSTVGQYLFRAQEAGISWSLNPDMDDIALERLLYPPSPARDDTKLRMPDMAYLHRELKRKSVTLQLLWYEYKEANPDGYPYSQFCNLYRQWSKNLMSP